MKKVAVIAGGISSERDVSLMSGQGVLDALKRKGYDAFLIDFDGNLKSWSIHFPTKNRMLFSTLSTVVSEKTETFKAFSI